MLIVQATVALLLGAFTFFGGRSEWAFFWTNTRAQQLVALTGQRGARWFYQGIGLAFFVIGLLWLRDGLLGRLGADAP